MPEVRQAVAYLIVSLFLFYIFLSGIVDPLHHVLDHLAGFPDFSHHRQLRTLDHDEFPAADPTRKVIIVGDIHGMIEPLTALLNKVNYVPSTDVLIHVGDVVGRAPLQGSLNVLDFLSTYNVTGVRGNHDQKVVEWRSWIHWIVSLSGGEDWLKRLERNWQAALEKDSNVDLDLWLDQERSTTDIRDKKWWSLVPRGWVPLSDHYNIAKRMSAKDFTYLLNLPLHLYIPHVHAFIVHAGMLPADPRYPLGDVKRQPMARVPHSRHHQDIEKLRQIQELDLLSKVPQNKDPWVALNMRSVLDGKVLNKSKKGTYWTKIWEDQMESCVGFDGRGLDLQLAGEDQETAVDSNVCALCTQLGTRKNLKLPCYPASTIYGHTASRGLDVKRWTFGLDSGCIYKRSLSALVIGGELPIAASSGEEENDDITVLEQETTDPNFFVERKNPKSYPMRTRFSDNLDARIVTVKC